MLPLILLPLGLDTLAVSLGLGIKNTPPVTSSGKKPIFPHWLRSAMLFSTAETLMPLIGLLVGYAASLVVSNILHYAGALLLIGLGAWELWEEMVSTPAPTGGAQRFAWGGQLVLALGVSMDELAVGFSLGAQPFGKAVGPLALCLYIGIQGFVMAALGIALGRGLRARMKLLKEASELIGAILLIGLGIWLLFFS